MEDTVAAAPRRRLCASRPRGNSAHHFGLAGDLQGVVANAFTKTRPAPIVGHSDVSADVRS